MFTEAFFRNHQHTLAGQYITNSKEVKPLFDFHYLDESVWQNRISWIDQQSENRADRQKVAQVLTAYNSKIGNSQQAFEHIYQFEKKEASVVIGGQQAGLFSGPLFTIYKAISIIRIAEEMSHTFERPVVPIFWIAGEDHDFDEVNHIYSLTSPTNIEKLKINKPRSAQLSISQLPIARFQWEELVNKLEKTLADSPRKNKLLHNLRETLRSDQLTLSDGFAKWMAHLFAPYGLLFLDADDPMLRIIEVPMWQRLLTQNQRIRHALINGKQQVEKLGFLAQTEYDDHCAHLFTYHQNQRKLLYSEKDSFIDKKSTLQFSASQLLELSQTSPHLFSNNVMTRPLMQEYLFPVLATVLGHAEIAYWAQTKLAFHEMHMRMPILMPRLEVTLLEPRVKKLLNQNQWTVSDVVTGRYDLQNEVLEEQDSVAQAFSNQLEQLKFQFSSDYTYIIKQIQMKYPKLTSISERNIQLIKQQIDFLNDKVLQTALKQEDSRQMKRKQIENTLMPFAIPQERVYNCIAYLNQYGDSWIHDMIQSSIPFDGKHYVFELAGGSA